MAGNNLARNGQIRLQFYESETKLISRSSKMVRHKKVLVQSTIMYHR